jgi:hypothetical protein
MLAGKWGVFSSIIGVFAAIPIGASASVLTVPPAEYRVNVNNQSFTSTTPISAGHSGDYAASVASGPGYAEADLIAIVSAGGNVILTSDAAEMIYYFGVQGASGVKVPVDISFGGYTSAKTVTVNGGSADVASVINSEVTGPGVGYLAAGCSAINFSCATSAPPIGSTTFDVTAGDQYTIDLTASITEFVGCAGCGAVGHAHIDPYLQIDPTFAQADEFNLVISEGVPNVPVAAPELSTWAMMLLGFAGLGCAGWRARRKTARAA